MKGIFKTGQEVEKIMNKFIEQNRQICWESAFTKDDEYCIGEKNVKKLVAMIYNKFLYRKDEFIPIQ